MTRLLPLLPILALLAACYPQSGSLSPSDPSDVDIPDFPTTPEPEPTFDIKFDGDVMIYPAVMLSCLNEQGYVIEQEGERFNVNGWAELFTEPDTCYQTFFNIWDDDGANTNQYRLGDVIVDEHGEAELKTGLPEAYNVLYLWVFTNTGEQGVEEGFEEGMLEPVTADGTLYFEGGWPSQPFDSFVGWEYELP